MVKMYTRFQTKTAQKPYPLGRHIPTLYVSDIAEVPSPGMEERMILVKVTHGFSRFYVKTRKQNNTYPIHQFIIGNVELRLIENG